MTKKEAIKAIEEMYKNGTRAFSVVSMNAGDVVLCMTTDNDFLEKFYKLDTRQKNQYMSKFVDDMMDMFENSPDWGFRKLFLDTLKERARDGREMLSKEDWRTVRCIPNAKTRRIA